MFLYFFGNICSMSISDVSKMYSYSSLKIQVALPICFLVILILTTYLTIYFFISPLCMSPQRCFRDLHLSGKNNSLRVCIGCSVKHQIGNLCPMSISDVSKMYSYSSLKRQVALPICFLVILILTAYLTICFLISPLCMSTKRCFRNLHLSGINNALRVMYRV